MPTRVAIIGTGWGARVQLPLFRQAGLVIAGIAGSDRGKTGRIASDAGVTSFDDWRALIDRSGADIVSIVTPPSQHRRMTEAAIRAGKHVISEKPTALDAREAAEMLEMTRGAQDRIHIIDHELRFLPSFREARRRIAEIGPLRYIEASYSSPGRGDRERAWNWWSDAEQGGGVWGAVGSHFVDAIRYLGWEIEAAQALLHTAIDSRPHQGGRRAVSSDDVALVHLRLRAESGRPVASISLSAVSSGPDAASMITLHGDGGAMRLTGEELLFAERGKEFRRIAGGEMQGLPGNSPGGAFGTGTLLLGQAVRQSLEGGGAEALAPAATFHDGLAQQRVLDAARESARSQGQWVTIGSDSETSPKPR